MKPCHFVGEVMPVHNVLELHIPKTILINLYRCKFMNHTSACFDTVEPVALVSPRSKENARVSMRACVCLSLCVRCKEKTCAGFPMVPILGSKEKARVCVCVCMEKTHAASSVCLCVCMEKTRAASSVCLCVCV